MTTLANRLSPIFWLSGNFIALLIHSLIKQKFYLKIKYNEVHMQMDATIERTMIVFKFPLSYSILIMKIESDKGAQI